MPSAPDISSGQRVLGHERAPFSYLCLLKRTSSQQQACRFVTWISDCNLDGCCLAMLLLRDSWAALISPAANVSAPEHYKGILGEGTSRMKGCGRPIL